jgi:hypothetical protein
VAQQRPWSAEHLSTRISREELDGISTRGREIAEYDGAAWHGTDAAQALRPPEGAADDTLYAAAAVTPVEADSGYFARAARAVDLAIHDFGPVTRPYNPVVLPIDGADDWFVYLVPAPTRFGFWPLGADVRYRVSADGRSVRERRRLHNTVIEYGPPSRQAGKELKAGFHTAVVADGPEDTDVFLVLTRQPRVPEYIVSETFYFRIDIDGRITAYDRDRTSK